MSEFGDLLNGSAQPEEQPPEPMAGMHKPQELTQGEQKDHLREIKKRSKYSLIKCTKGERDRIAKHIIQLYKDAKPSHEELVEKINDWDEVSRLVRKEVVGSDGTLPNYRLPMSLVAHEVIHANVMNVFFSPKEPMRCLPTAADDIDKVESISVFGNWSMRNEMQLFENCDKLFHASEKNGEAVAMIYWKKEIGVEIKRVPVRDAEGNVQYDDVTDDPIFEEIEEPKVVYNAPFLEIIPRADYIQPEGSIMGETPEWEAVIRRINYDSYLRDQLQGKYYEDSIDEIQDWASASQKEIEKPDVDGDDTTVPKWSKEFLSWYGRMRISVVEAGEEEAEQVKAYELEDEFIGLVHIKTQTLCCIKKNRFPMKLRPFVNDYFMPDDSGRRVGIGVYELMDSLQKCYDKLYNEFIYAVELSNNPIGFFTPIGNQRDESIKIQKGYLYPTSDANSTKLFQFPPPNDSLKFALEMIQQWAQFLFGISDYAAGIESTIDPTAPAKKAQIVVEQGNVRLNMIIKRKAETMREIFKRWFLLYRDNMPKNKFMRITGEGENKDPWKFEPISYEDFALKSLPDFELTGNILNANKQLEAQKSIAIYQLLVTNVFFQPNTAQGLKGLSAITKWLIDKLDDGQGLSRFMPEIQNEGVLYTPEEENASMMQGNDIVPLENEDHMDHLKKHMQFMNNPNTPEEIKVLINKHIQATIEMIKHGQASQLAQQNAGMPPQGGMNAQGANPVGAPGQGGAPQGVPSGQPANMA